MEERKERNEDLKVNKGIKEEQQEVLVTDNSEEETSSKKGIFIGAAVVAIVILLAVIAIIVITKKGKSEVQQSTAIEEVTVEESAEVQKLAEEETVVVEESTEEATVEEVQVEDSTANLSNEEWVKSLNVERPTFLVFNEITGERKALEDGAEYTLIEGDELAIEIPSRWLWQGDNIPIYETNENKYNCLVYHLNYDMIGEKTEFTTTYNNRDGEPVTATVYLSK